MINVDELGKNVWSLLSAVGGVSAIIGGLSVWIGSILANRFNEKFRLASEQQIKLLEVRHAKELSELQYEHDKKLDEQKQMLQYEFDAQRQKLQIEATQNMRFLEKQFDLYLALWDKLQELNFAVNTLWQEASIENLGSFTEAYQQTGLIADKVSLVMDEDNYQMLRDSLKNLERFQIGKRRLIELRTRNSVKLAFDEYIREGRNERQFTDQIRFEIDSNRFHRDRYQRLLENIRQELQVKLAGNPLAKNLSQSVRDMSNFF